MKGVRCTWAAAKRRQLCATRLNPTPATNAKSLAAKPLSVALPRTRSGAHAVQTLSYNSGPLAGPFFLVLVDTGFKPRSAGATKSRRSCAERTNSALIVTRKRHSPSSNNVLKNVCSPPSTVSTISPTLCPISWMPDVMFNGREWVGRTMPAFSY